MKRLSTPGWIELSNIMSLPLDFRSASDQELPFGSTLDSNDSQGLGSRPVCTNDVPIQHLSPRDKSIRAVTLHYPSNRIAPPSRHYLPSVMTDLKLGVTYDGMPITSFCYFVAPELTASPRTFSRLMDFPPEIHRVIFGFCDKPTLFHLMHTSSYTRQICSDMFWKSNEEDVWYHPANASEIFGWDHAIVSDCPEFASRVTQVEISLSFLTIRDKFSEPRKRHEFWRRVQSIFPAAEKVVISDTGLDRALFSLTPEGYLDGPWRKEQRNISELVVLAPPNITVMVATFDPTDYSFQFRRVRSQLWSVDASHWTLVENLWTPMRVVLPPKRMPPGLLSYFLAFRRNDSVILNEVYGANWLIWETYVRFADAGGMECPHPDCDDRFPNTAAWEWHLQSEFHKGNIKNHIKPQMLMYHRNTPAEMKSVIDEKRRRFVDGSLVMAMMSEELWQLYRKYGGSQFEATLAHEMEEFGFIASGQSASEWGFWLEILSDYPGDSDDNSDDNLGYHENYEVDSDQEYPDEQMLDHAYASEQNFDSLNGSYENMHGQSHIGASQPCSTYAGEQYFDYSQCFND